MEHARRRRLTAAWIAGRHLWQLPQCRADPRFRRARRVALDGLALGGLVVVLQAHQNLSSLAGTPSGRSPTTGRTHSRKLCLQGHRARAGCSAHPPPPPADALGPEHKALLMLRHFASRTRCASCSRVRATLGGLVRAEGSFGCLASSELRIEARDSCSWCG